MAQTQRATANDFLVTESPYDREALNRLEAVFGKQYVSEKHEAHAKSTILRSGLREASKVGRGPGYPDGVVFLDSDYRAPFILMEAKAPNKVGEAWDDLNHYAKHLSASNIIVPFGLAVSGSLVQLKKWNESEGAYAPIEILDLTTGVKSQLVVSPTLEELSAYKDELKDAHLRNSPTIQVNPPGFSQDEVLSFCVRVNKKFHGMGIKEGTRPTILTYFLICCLDPDFLVLIDTLKKTPAALVSHSSSVFNDVIKKRKFSLNTNIFSILSVVPESPSPEGVELSDTDQKSIQKYSDAYLAIFDLIDAEIAERKDPACNTRQDFVLRLLQSGNFLGDAYEVFHTYTAGNDMGQYFTPRHAVDLTISVVESLRGKPVSVDDVIYDPACGVGGFLCLAMKHAVSGLSGERALEALQKLGDRIYGAEVEPTIADMAKVNLLLRGDGKSGITTGSSLDRDWPGGNSPIRARFTKDETAPTLVLMNPPFPSSNSNFKSYDFITHALDVSAEGAWIAAIVPLSVLNGRNGFRDFRRDTLGRATLRAAITLPADLFQPKAQADTAIVVLQKTAGGHSGDVPVVFSAATADGLRMHKGKKQRVSDFNTTDDFRLLRHQWLNARHNEIPEKFRMYNPFAEADHEKEFKAGGEWQAERWLNDDPINTDLNELLRLSKYILADYSHAGSVKNLGGKW